MFPLRDDIPSRTTPVVNYFLIAITTLVWFAQLAVPSDMPSLVERYGMIPARVENPDAPIVIPERFVEHTPYGTRQIEIRREAAPAAVPAWLTLLTCIFLHGGWLHFLGNMWFLWIFGDNVEDRLGHFKYLLFYLGAGVAASAAHLLTNPVSQVPTIGASGAIAGVMGAYFFLYPRARVLTLIPVFVFLHMTVLPAALFLGIWFLLQFFQGVMSISGTQATGVAWWAHIGGFAAGAILIVLLANLGLLREEVRDRRVYARRVVRPPRWPS